MLQWKYSPMWSGFQHKVHEIPSLVLDCALTASESTFGIQNIFPQKQVYMWLLNSQVHIEFSTGIAVMPNMCLFHESFTKLKKPRMHLTTPLSKEESTFLVNCENWNPPTQAASSPKGTTSSLSGKSSPNCNAVTNLTLVMCPFETWWKPSAF